jgi:class 3 adenylate cyclase
MDSCAACGTALPAGARFCPACGAPITPSAPSGDERKLATVLFADLVGSTALASGEDPERVRVRLDRFYATMSHELEVRGGTVEKYAGDAVMAVFGAPTALEDHAERALHAALAMQHRHTELFPGLGLRIGVNTGEVVSGAVRGESGYVTGDTVNVGARLEQAAGPGEVLAGERTYAAARGAFEFGPRRVVEAKGKPGGVPGRPVLGALMRARPRGVGGLRRVFVGREVEVDLLRATYRRVAVQEEPHLVTVVGEPGIGKTRLIEELWGVLGAEERPPLRRLGGCLPYGDGITYWPLAEVLRDHFGIEEDQAPSEVARCLAGREILGLAFGLDVARGLHPLDAREQLHRAVVELVDGLASEQPLALLFEDVHWAEDDLLDLIERIVQEARGSLLLIATARPALLDRRPGWGSGRRNATSIWLEPLGRDAASRMLEDLLAVDPPESVRRLVVDRAEGNPFFVEELVGSLIDAGVLTRTAAGWRASDVPHGFSVPDTVHALVAARVDDLPPREKAALQAAAVVGRTFWPSAVTHLLGGDEPDLGLLEERDLVRAQGRSSISDEREYAMKHALTQEVAYGSIPKARRGRLHASLAVWLETGERSVDELAPLLAYHYAEAARPEDADLVWPDDADELRRVRARAVHWLTRAGELARRRYEIDEAVELFNRAVEIVDDEHERALLWRAIGEAQALRYDGEAMRTALLRSLDGPLDDEERGEAYALLAFQASLRSSMWAIRLSRASIEEWAARALEYAPERSETRVRAVLARANVDPVSTPREELEAVGELAAELRSLELHSYALGARSVAAFERRDYHEAAIWSERRLELLPGIDDPDHLCEAYESSAPIAAAVARFDESARLASMHAELSRRLSPHHRVHSISLDLELADVLGDWTAIRERTGRVFDAVGANLTTPCVRNPRGLYLCALAHLCTGDDERAVELERDAARVGGTGYDSYLSGPRLRIALERGDRSTAMLLLELPLERGFVWGAGAMAARLDAMAVLRRSDLVEFEAPAFATAGVALEPFALRALGIVRDDDDLLARADVRFAALGLEWHRAQTERLRAGVP